MGNWSNTGEESVGGAEWARIRVRGRGGSVAIGCQKLLFPNLSLRHVVLEKVATGQVSHAKTIIIDISGTICLFLVTSSIRNH